MSISAPLLSLSLSLFLSLFLSLSLCLTESVYLLVCLCLCQSLTLSACMPAKFLFLLFLIFSHMQATLLEGVSVSLSLIPSVRYKLVCQQYTIQILWFYSKNKVVWEALLLATCKFSAGFCHFWVPQSSQICMIFLYTCWMHANVFVCQPLRVCNKRKLVFYGWKGEKWPFLAFLHMTPNL